MPEIEPESGSRQGGGLAGRGVALGLGLTSWLRAGKAVHPDGEAYRGRLSIDGSAAAPGASPLLSRAGGHTVVVRFSRSLGLPRPLPDLLGMAVRVIDAYGPGRDQDLLMISSIDLPLLHHLFVPAGGVDQRVFSSSIPYRSGDESVLIGARAAAVPPHPDVGDEYEPVGRASATGLRFDLLVARHLERFRRIGEVSIEERLPAVVDALPFNPFNTGPGLDPSGRLSEWRRAAYPASQRAWGRTGRRVAAQREAQAVVRGLPRTDESG